MTGSTTLSDNLPVGFRFYLTVKRDVDGNPNQPNGAGTYQYLLDYIMNTIENPTQYQWQDIVDAMETIHPDATYNYWFLTILDTLDLNERTVGESYTCSTNPTDFNWIFKYDSGVGYISFDCGTTWYAFVGKDTSGGTLDNLQEFLDVLAQAYPTDAYDAAIDGNNIIRI